MPVRNFWSFEPGECFTAEKLGEQGLKVFFPLKDVGVDLLVVSGKKHVGIQVKESRYYRTGKWRSGHVGHSWHQIRKKKLEDDVDFYVFLTYEDASEGRHTAEFVNKFLIVPKDELMKRIAIKDPGKSGVYSFYFHFEKDRVWDERVTVSVSNELTDYTEFLDAWDLVEKAVT